MLNFSKVHGIQIGSSAQQNFLTPPTLIYPPTPTSPTPCPPRPSTPPMPHSCPPSYAPPLPLPTLAETTGNILPEARMRRKSKSLPWDVSKTGQQTVHYQVIKCMRAFWRLHKAQPQAAAIGYSTTKRQITDSTTATRQLSSIKPNDESRRKGNKERRKWTQAVTHFSSVYSLLFYEIVNHAWTWWRWWKVVKEPA